MADGRGLVQWLQRREIAVYPRGWLQVWLLTLVVVANLIHSYEGQLGPVVPLLVPALHLSLNAYGYIVAATTVVSGAAAVAAGPWIDRYGRTAFVIGGTVVTALAVLAMALVHTAAAFVVVRVILAIGYGVAYPATSGLVRDFTPRVGRALGFGLWTLGPVGADFLAAWVAGWSLPLFHDAWQSQFVIMGGFCLVTGLVVAAFIRDLSPALRSQVVRDRREAEEADRRARQTPTVMAHPRLVFRAWHVWALAVGQNLFLLIYFFTTAFGPLYLVQVFHYPPAVAAQIASTFWLADLGALILIGWVSDRARLRKPFSMAGVVGMTIFMYFWIHLIGQRPAPSVMVLYTSLQGVLLALGYGPWMALYSETLEDIHPSLVGTGWAISGLVVFVVAALADALTFPVVGRIGYAGWLTVCWIGIVVYGVVLLVVPGAWRHAGRAAGEVEPKAVGWPSQQP
ncbi:MAG: MFS transporter [Actinomycetia bacterium]|nr:MFS transporter [Actinomycetes bacterium]